MSEFSLVLSTLCLHQVADKQALRHFEELPVAPFSFSSSRLPFFSLHIALGWVSSLVLVPPTTIAIGMRASLTDEMETLAPGGVFFGVVPRATIREIHAVEQLHVVLVCVHHNAE
jgi:hypothetical protein